jgi:hypothetical protein
VLKKLYHALQAQLQPHFDAKAWLPFKMAQGTVKWSIAFILGGR